MTEPIDVREIPLTYHATRQLAAEIGGCTTLSNDESLQQRLLTAALIRDLDAREATAAAAPGPDDRLTLAAAVAGRLLRDRSAWADRDGLWWRRVATDPVLGGGPAVATPAAGTDGWARRLGIGRRTAHGAEPVTADTVRTAVERGSSYLQLGERIDDWSAVALEIGALVARRP